MLRIYQPIIRRVDVVLLSYKVPQIETFHDLEYWAEKVCEISSEQTNLILVGTHPDQKENHQFTPESIATGKKYVIELI